MPSIRWRTTKAVGRPGRRHQKRREWARVGLPSRGQKAHQVSVFPRIGHRKALCEGPSGCRLPSSGLSPLKTLKTGGGAAVRDREP